MVYCVEPNGFANIMQGNYDRKPNDPPQEWYNWGAYRSRLEPWMFDSFPTVLRVHPSYPLTDVAMFGFYGVSEAIKRAIEDIEPGVHQFVPFKLIYGVPDASALEPEPVIEVNEQGRIRRVVYDPKFPQISPTEHQYYTFWCNNRFPEETRHPESPVDWDKGRHKEWPACWSKDRGVPLALCSEIIGNRHFFRLSTEYYISDALYEHFRRNKLGSGWVFEKQIVV